MTEANLKILTNIIGAVESGGQVYGQRDYAAYAPAYANSKEEHTCTLGWCQFYGANAKKLIKKIFDKDKAAFRKVDTANIEKKLSVDWVVTKWNPSSAEKKALIAIITTAIGKQCQDEMFIESAKATIKNANAAGCTAPGPRMMYVEIAHLGGESAAKRIFGKTSKPYTVDKIYATLLLDQKESNTNLVGSKIYQSRHDCCIKWIKKYVKKYDGSASTATATTSTTTESITTSGKYDKYIFSTGTHYISNSGHDENYSYYGGQAGDQTGTEWELRSHYVYPWDCVIRHPDINVGLKMAELACAAALNDNIGYNQWNRDSFWNQLKSVGYDPSKITKACDDDCSAGVIAITKAVGYLFGITRLQNISATYTGNMKEAFQNAGFQILTDSKYTSSSAYLLPGDILLNIVNHTATNITKGSKASMPTSTTNSSATTSDSSSEISNKVKWNGKVDTGDDTLNVRQWAGSEYPTCSFSPLDNGAVVGVCDSLKASDGSTWYFICYNNKYGFVHGDYISK